MTFKQELAKSQLIAKYQIEVNNYEAAIKRGGQFTEFSVRKAAEFNAKIDALNDLDKAA